MRNFDRLRILVPKPHATSRWPTKIPGPITLPFLGNAYMVIGKSPGENI
ncbi:hypothetical protein NQ317_016366 [Molorchus minor]|uniref:Cytochrome P450 n=1 Tax=Molorchus minor TaxID=1323400 RepID=A0ABQ9JFB2_9CUCU|nr:hypothetical protein NQ317_016366 [Molorchus minor]